MNKYLLVVIYFALILHNSYAIQESPDDIEQILKSMNLSLELPSVNTLTGALQYEYKLDLPPGIKDSVPQLSIIYNSNNDSSVVGFGWTIPFPFIERSTRNGIPNYNMSDTFFLTLSNCGEMVPVGNNEWRCSRETGTGLRIKYLGDTVGWVVTDKEGKRYFFGENTNSRLSKNGDDAYTFRWSLNRVLDLNGNYMTIEYIEYDMSNGVEGPYIYRIKYTGNEKTGYAPPNTITFEYERNYYYISDYSPGFLHLQTALLKKIKIERLNELVRIYEFNYKFNTETNRVLLTSIFHIGRDGVSADPPVKFNYTVKTRGWSDVSNIYTLPEVLAREGYTTACDQSKKRIFDTGVRMTDVNGDGLIDIIRSDDTVTAVWLNAGWTGESWNGFIYNQHWTDVLRNTGVKIIKEYSCSRKKGNNCIASDFLDQGIKFIDINGDGFVDIIQSLKDVDGTQKNTVFLNTGNGFVLDPQWSSSIPVIAAVIEWEFPSVDNCADGNNLWKEPFITIKDKGVRFVDVNGDRRIDIIQSLLNGTNLIKNVWINTGNGFARDPTLSDLIPLYFVVDEKHDNGVRLIDINRDGLVDIVQSLGFTNEKSVYLNTGNGWELNMVWTTNIPMPFVEEWGSGDQTWEYDSGVRIADINGDKTPDLIRSSNMNNSPYGRGICLNDGMSGWFCDAFWDDKIPDAFVDDWVFARGVYIVDVDGNGSEDFIRSYKNSDGSQSIKIWLSSHERADLLQSVENSAGGRVEVEYGSSFMFSQQFLPQPLAIVKRITSSDGLGNTHTVNFVFTGGAYDPLVKEFHGFRKMERIDEGYKIAVVYNKTDPVFYGFIERTEEKTIDGRIIASVDYFWNNRTIFQNVNCIFLSREVRKFYSPMEITIGTSYNYDDFGNKTLIHKEGFTEVPDDDVYINIEYAYNLSNWNVSNPAKIYITDSLNNKLNEQTFYYDHLSYGNITSGNLTKITRWLEGGNSPEINIEYDSYGNLKKIYDPLGNPKSFYYTTPEFPSKIVNALGHIYKFTYHESYGVISSIEDPNGLQRIISVDAFGRINAIYEPGDDIRFPTRRFNYDFNSRPVRITEFLTTGNKAGDSTYVHAYFNGYGNLIGVKRPSSVPGYQIITGEKEYYFGNVVKEYLTREIIATNPPEEYVQPDRNFPHYSYEYDVLGNPLKKGFPDGHNLHIEYNGNLTTVIDQQGNIYTYRTDAFGNIVEILDPEGGLAKYKYDHLGNLVEVTDPEGNSYSIEYDTLQRKRRIIDPDSGLTTMEYDLAGNIIFVTDNKGTVTSYVYDKIGRVVSKSYSNSSQKVEYFYDDAPNGIGKLSMIVDTTGTTWFQYDPRGNPVVVGKVLNNTNYILRIRYNSLGQVLSVTYPDGEVVNYEYDNRSLVKAMTGEENYVSQIEYGMFGMKKMNLGNGITLAWNYDELSGVLKEIKGANGNVTLFHRQYEYNSLYYITKINDLVHGSSETFEYDSINRLIKASGPYGLIEYKYSPSGNIIYNSQIGDYEYASKPHAVIKAGNIEFAYDENGRMRKSGNWVYEYDPEGRLTGVTNSTTKEGILLEYDGDGGLVRKTSGEQSIIYFGKLLEISEKDNQYVKHYYVNNLLVASKRVVTPKLSLVFNNENEQNGEKNGPNFTNVHTDSGGKEGCGCNTGGRNDIESLTLLLIILFIFFIRSKKKIKRTGIIALIIIIITSSTSSYLFSYDNIPYLSPYSNVPKITETFYYVLDHQQNVAVVLDQNGGVIKEFVYAPYGTPYLRGEWNQPVNLGVETEKLYNSHEWLAQPQLYFYNARFYNPILGRFITPDPVPKALGTQGLNRYSYTLNNPVNFIDPTGNIFWFVLGAVAFVGLYFGITAYLIADSLKKDFGIDVGNPLVFGIGGFILGAGIVIGIAGVVALVVATAGLATVPLALVYAGIGAIIGAGFGYFYGKQIGRGNESFGILGAILGFSLGAVLGFSFGVSGPGQTTFSPIQKSVVATISKVMDAYTIYNSAMKLKEGNLIDTVLGLAGLIGGLGSLAGISSKIVDISSKVYKYGSMLQTAYEVNKALDAYIHDPLVWKDYPGYHPYEVSSYQMNFSPIFPTGYVLFGVYGAHTGVVP